MVSDHAISNDARKAVAISQIVVYVLLMTPFMIYNLRRLSLLKNSILVQKRHPIILWIESIFVVSWFSFVAPIMAIDFAQLSEFSLTTQEILSRINCTLFPLCTFGFTLTNAWRFWLIFYELKYNSSQKNNEWKHFLDAKRAQRVFWLNHRIDYGSFFYTKKLFFIVYFITAFIMIICYQCVIGTPYMMLGHGLAIIIHLPTITFLILVWWKLPSYKDDLYVSEEVKLVCIAFIICTTFSNIIVVSCLIMSYNIIIMMTCISGSLLVAPISMVSYWWVPRKVAGIELEQRILRTSTLMSRGDSGDLGLVAEFKAGKTNKQRDKQKFNSTLRRLSQDNTNREKSHNFFAIASNPATFKMLMQHLGKEFSLENMLSFVEIAQYKFALKLRCDRIDPKLIDQTDVFGNKMPMSNVVEMSAINRNGFNALSSYKRDEDSTKLLIEHAKDVCIELYKKYMEEGSELEINIGYEERVHLKFLFANETEFRERYIEMNQLFTVFDDAATEVLRLLKSAFFRFQCKKDVFKKACQILDENIKK